MSAYHQVNTEFKDKDCLVKGLNDMGYTEVEVHDIPQNLIGYHGDTRQQKAHVIVRRRFISSAANDLGFVRGEDGKFRSIISDYDSNKHNATWMTQLKDKVAEHGAMSAAKKRGLILISKKIVNGKVQLKFMDRSKG